MKTKLTRKAFQMVVVFLWFVAFTLPQTTIGKTSVEVFNVLNEYTLSVQKSATSQVDVEPKGREKWDVSDEGYNFSIDVYAHDPKNDPQLITRFTATVTPTTVPDKSCITPSAYKNVERRIAIQALAQDSKGIVYDPPPVREVAFAIKPYPIH